MDLASKPVTTAAPAAENLKPDRLLISNNHLMQTILVDPQQDRQINLADPLYRMADTPSDTQIAIKAGVVTIDGQVIAPKETRKVGQLSYHLVPQAVTQYFDLMGVNELFGGPYAGDAIYLQDTKVSFALKRQADHFDLVIYAGSVYLRTELVGEGTHYLGFGDPIYFADVRLTPKRDHLEVHDPFGKATLHLRVITEEMIKLPDDYPNYHRSPRIIYRAPQTQVKVEAPEQEPTSPDQHLGRVILPPVVMVAMSIMMITLSGSNPVMMLSMVGMSLATVVGSITSYFHSKTEYREQTADRKQKYEAYLDEENGKLNELSRKQRYALDYHYPNLNKIGDMIHHVDPRIYEKTPLHFDFLTYRLGLGTVPTSYKIDFDAEAFSEDPLIHEGQAIKDYHATLAHAPITTDLMHGPVGIIGQRSLVIEHIQQMILQLATFHSYHDVEFLAVFPEAEKDQWWWLRWLPHFTLHAMNVRGFVWHDRSRDQVLNSFYQILKERDQELKESSNAQEKLQFKPHYVLFLANDELILDHPIMEYLTKDLTDLGVSLVFVADVIQSLPEHVTTVIDIGDRQHGKVLLEQGKLSDQAFVPDHFPETFDRNQAVHELAGLHHLESLKNSIPKSVTFMEMYGKKHVADLDIGHRWQTNKPFKSLAVPLGERAPEDIVTLNLHEKADGPHGLLAGTTGSGKSEVLQSYILSMAVNFKPSDVGFLLIDYKGGGMANLFKNLPHLLGAITNLDGAQSMRALESIRAELRRRQRLFGEFNVNHINQYQRLYNEGVAKEPIPHLFLISDEFAELKTNQPDFMTELVSTARIGRSLGVHLILATQKPSGVVDDQIWSNSKFKISLKVQDKADSNEILHTPDAASIVEPGRGYLQVGNNEKYELFQTAYSGAAYDPDKDEQQVSKLPLYTINEMGQYEILTKDLSDERGEKTADIKKKPTELEAVIDYIHDYAAKHDIHRLPQPWLPPLKKIISPEVPIDRTKAWLQPTNLKVAIGETDIPSEQAQRPLMFDLAENADTAVFASAGYGKSTFLQTVVMQLARENNPDQIQFYLLDFGTNGLLPLRDLPHVADIIRADEVAKLSKFIRLIRSELKRRKSLLNKAGVATLAQYETATGKHIPVLEIVIDGFDAIVDAKYEDAVRSMASVLSREGAGVGIYLLISAAQQSVLRNQLVANIKTQVSLFLIEQDDVQNIVGRTKLKIEDTPGRGLIKLDEPRLIQIYTPNDEQDGLAILTKIQEEAKAMRAEWRGNLPQPIPMVPEEFTFEEFFKRADVQTALDDNILPFGLDLDTTHPVGPKKGKDGYIVIGNSSGSQFEGFERLLQQILAHLDTKAVVFDPEAHMQANTPAQTVVQSADKMKQSLTELLDLINAGDPTALKGTVVIINNLEAFIKKTQLTDVIAKQMVQALSNNGVQLIVNTYQKYIANQYDAVINEFLQPMTQGIFGTRIQDQVLIHVPSPIAEPFLEANEAYYFKDRDIKKFRFPLK